MYLMGTLVIYLVYFSDVKIVEFWFCLVIFYYKIDSSSFVEKFFFHRIAHSIFTRDVFDVEIVDFI